MTRMTRASWARSGVGALGPLLVALLSGCGGAAEPVDGAGVTATTAGAELGAEARALDPLAVLPANAFAVIDIDLVRLRQSPHWPRLSGWLVQFADDPQRQALVREVLGRAERIVVGLVDTEGADDAGAVMVVRGDLGAIDLGAVLPESTVSTTDVASGHALHTFEGLAAAAVDGETWVIAPLDTMGPALERALGRATGAGPLAADPALAAMATRIGFGQAAVTAVGHVPPEVRDGLGDDRYLAAHTAEAMRTAGVRVQVEDGLALELVVEMVDEAQARALAARGVALQRWAGSHPLVGLMGLRPLLEGLHVRSEALHAVLNLNLGAADFDRLVRRFESLAEGLLQVGGMGGGSGKGAPQSSSP
jgi:hypothetical protein